MKATNTTAQFKKPLTWCTKQNQDQSKTQPKLEASCSSFIFYDSSMFIAVKWYCYKRLPYPTHHTPPRKKKHYKTKPYQNKNRNKTNSLRMISKETLLRNCQTPTTLIQQYFMAVRILREFFCTSRISTMFFICAKRTYGRPTWNCRWFLLAQRTWTLKATHVSSFSVKMHHVTCLDPGLDRKILGGFQHHILGISFIWNLIFVNYKHFTLWVALPAWLTNQAITPCPIPTHHPRLTKFK